ncbi:MAG: InlB B-repeat-containing protein, partial [Clostridia bacterium]|nr:InlB B-repeat-containing protein [Clostridia bacterium]
MKTKTQFHKLTAWLLTLAMLMTFIPSFTLAASAAESLTDSTTGVILADSDGDDYYEVDTPDKLVAFANLVNAGNDSINIELTDDIDMTGKEWSMIVYGGTIDGNEHTVSNLTFVATEAEGEQYAGLIYAYDATVRNITFKNCRTVINSETSSGRDIYAAIIAPVAIGGIFENCSLVDSTVTQSGMASGCSYAGSLAGLTAYGLKITGCSVEGCTVTDDSESEDGNFAGGLAGGFWADEAAYDFGVQVKNNTINADVTAKNSPGVDAASGLICSVLDDSLAIVQVYDNCIVDGTIIADDVAAGLIGDCIGYDMTISNCTVLCDSISAAQGDPFAYGEWAQKGEHDYYTMTYSDLKISENTEFVCKQFENTLGKYYLSDLYADGAFDADIVSFADSAAEVSYAVTVSDSIENGTVVADVSEAAEGDTVTLTVTPADGYKLDTLTVKDADNGNVTVTDNKFTMPAKAVTVTATFKEVAIGHIHSICGEEHTEIGDHNSVGCAEVTYAAFPTATDSDTSDGITATVSDGKVAVTLVGGEESNPKTYNLYLNGDIALSKPLNIPAYTTLNLCLNGFALDASAASESIYQQVALLIGGTASTLNLCDCNGSYNIHKFTADDTGKWTMDESGNQEISGGVIIGGSVDNSGTFNMYGGSIVGASKRGVLNRYNSINSTFNMYAGEIVGNADGGVDCNYTEFTLYGGKIHNNVTVKNGAGILANYTTFNMYGGEIYKNTSTYEPETNKINGGGGVFFNGNASNVFTMTGGKIHNNSAARDGGGVLIQGAAFSLSGGEISENITAKKGGGVILDTFNTVSISGGSITGNKAEIGGGAYSIGGGDVQLSGRVKITDNTLADGSTASNLYLARTENILQLSVTGALENEAHIGVSMEIPDIFTTAGTYTVTNDDKTKFTSDSDAYEVELTDGVLSLQPMVPRVATPENPRWLYTSAAFWDAVDGATGYALKLYAGGTTEAHLVQRLSVGNEVSAYLYNILSGIVDDADLDSAEFYFSVRAKGNNYTTADSEWSEIIGPQTHVQPVPVLIVTQPTTQSVMVGSSATFSITAAGDSPITYQWQFSKDDGSTWENVVYNQTDSTLSGTTATYTVNNVTTDMNGWQYRCVATNMSGTKTATSEAVTLAVKEIFTVTFNANGGTCETTSAETVDGKLAELPTPTYDGYVFNGWFDAAEGGNKITISTVFDADTTIYAQWTQKIVITADMITVDEETYNGEQQLPNETIIVNGQPLVRNVDYSVQVWPDANYYRDAGEWEFFIHMDMNPVYIGEKIRMVQTIHKATPTITAPSAIPDLIYDGSKQVLINAGSTTGGTIQYSLDNASWSTELPMATNAGEYTVYYKVVGDSNYKDVGAVSTLVTIAPASLADAIVTLDEDTFTYDGQPHKPGVTVELNGKTLTVGTDYQVTYRVPLKLTGDKPTEWMDPNIVPVTFTDAGIMYYAVIEGMGNYYTENDTTLYARFRIEPKEVTAPTFADLEESYLYQDGAEIKPTFNLMDGDKKILAREYTVSYSNNTEVGTATITITDKAGGNYTVSGSTTFEIVVHEHVWNYTASGDTITATCSGTIGTCPVENNTVTIKLNAPENLTYDGNAKNVTVTQTPAGVFGDIPAVTYVGDCMNCATHTANLTYGEKTASLDFTIEKATISNVSF